MLQQYNYQFQIYMPSKQSFPLIKYKLFKLYQLFQIQMLSRLPKNQQKTFLRQQKQKQQSGQQSKQVQQNQKVQTKFLPKSISKDHLYVNFSGIIQSGYVTDQQSLSVMFILFTSQNSQDWKIVHGQKSGMSQVGSSYANLNKKIIWNFPFQITYETTIISGWPQIIFIVYGSDFFGRNVIKAYGNHHLPSSQGTHQRRVNLFKPLPQSLITGFFGYLNGCIAEYKEPQKILGTGQGREVTRVQTAGYLNIKVQTVKYNFNLFGYS